MDLSIVAVGGTGAKFVKDRELRVMSTEKKSKAQNVSSDKNKQAAPKLKFVLLPSEEAQKVSLDKKKRATPKLKRKQTTRNMFLSILVFIGALL